MDPAHRPTLRLAAGPKASRRRLLTAPARDWGLADPKNAVLVLLTAVLLLGGGRRWLQARRARAAVDRLSQPGLTPEIIAAVARHGRAGLMNLFALLSTAPEPHLRAAAGRALADLWAQDQLVPEEEKAVVRRGFEVAWHARKRYPRALRVPIPMAVSYGVPFLRAGAAGIGPENLEWSHRLLGAERAGLETFSPWAPGPGRVEFTIDPGDFPGAGPHRLVLQARVRTRGVTSAWEFELPQMPFPFEFDPNLAVEALLSLPDAAGAELLARAVRLERPEPSPTGSRFLDLGSAWALRDPPVVAVTTPLPYDFAHALALEIEGVPGRWDAGQVLLSGQGTGRSEPAMTRAFPLGPIRDFPADALDRPGERRLRAILTADPERGWADPDIRSLWPGTITTAWCDVRIVRR
jgi:hypothetical protein